MRFNNTTATWVIGAVGVVCIVGNLWITTARSLIPRAIDDVVVRKEIGREKHPGEDDVHWLVLENAGKVHVDGAVWEGVGEGERIGKVSWSEELTIEDAKIHQLRFSDDVRGMIWVMGGALVVVALLSFQTTRHLQGGG